MGIGIGAGFIKILAWIAVLGILLTACSTPVDRLDKQASELGFSREWLQGTDYAHLIYRNSVAGPLLHVYLEGDGTPWLNRFVVAADPTPRNPMMLSLMALDSAPSLYLGRPCYHGQSGTPPCSPLLWTNRRYSEEVVDSMAAALQEMVERSGYEGLVFLGHSGGGTLAMLLAERFQETRAVLTVAGNLDPVAWAAWHGYSPLYGSLNPALREPLPPDIVQLHFVGERDQSVPPQLVYDAVARQPHAGFVVVDTFDHKCCWQKIWSAVLDRLQSALSKRQ